MELNYEEQKVLEKVAKLLSLAGNNPNEEEANSATAKAMELLEIYNLSISQLDSVGKDATKRADGRHKGGLYPWQVHLWHSLSELNFCMYFHYRGTQKGQKYEHRVLGHPANVASTVAMAEYLQATIERLARNWAGAPTEYFTKSAHSYREGMCHRVVERLVIGVKKQDQEDALRKAEWAAQHPTGNALVVIDDVRRKEEEANYDHLHGAGKWAAREAALARWRAEAEEDARKQKLWDDAHPEEAAARKAKANADAEKLIRNYRPRRYKGDANAYWQGHAKGNEIGLDKQIAKKETRSIG